MFRGTVLTYTGTFTNSGTSSAFNLTLLDPIPTHTDVQIGSATANLGTSGLTLSAISYFNGNTSTWGYTPGGGGATGDYDRLVTQVKFSFSGSLGNSSPKNTRVSH
jgi:uncharacterized repeat protein (TIGR01451 family)